MVSLTAQLVGMSLGVLLAVFMPDADRAAAAENPVDGPATVEFFVSPQGNDAWLGRLAAPSGKDGPFATLERARDAVRALRRSQAPPRPVRVVLRGGTYYLDRTLDFGPPDSGTKEAPVIYAAADGETVTLSGGRRLEGGHWGELKGRKVWVVDLPEVKAGKWDFHQLFVSGERRTRTRLPKEGWSRVESVPDYDASQPDDDQHNNVQRFKYAGTDIQPWHNIQDVEVVAFETCNSNRLPIRAVDGSKRLVTLGRPSRGNLMYGGPARYWVENVFEALDTPGQWYLDRPLGRLYYLPLPGEDMKKAVIIAPRLPQLLRIEGTQDTPVNHLHFEGLTFAHTEWSQPPDWPSEGRYTGAWYDLPAAIRLTNASECAVTGCVIEHGAAYGVEVREGCRDVEISRNRMSDLGAGGVKLWFKSARSTVADNEIGHTGLIFMTSYGICVADSPGNQIIYNHIYDRHYTGILVGWSMYFEESNAYGNVVEHNHIHDIGKGVVIDMGGIYTEGICAGSRIRYNVVHDIRSRAGDEIGIYHDSGADILVENNLAYRCTPLHIHYTRNITLENNIFAFGDGAQVTTAGVFDEPMPEYTFQRNIVYFNRGKVIGRWNPKNHNCAFDHNLYWNASGAPLLFGDASFGDWQKAGHDRDSLTADPLFVDPERGDFNLRSGSPAAQIGFEPWDLSGVGPRPRGSGLRSSHRPAGRSAQPEKGGAAPHS
jgi:parallel beta helix pectate lyase-like protein/glycosyl hydrolase family 141